MRKFLKAVTLLTICSLMVAISTEAMARKKNKRDKRRGKQVEEAGPQRYEERSSVVEKVPSYVFPFPGTFDWFTISRDYPSVRRWQIPESTFRKTVAVKKDEKLPNVRVRITEKVVAPPDPAELEAQISEEGLEVVNVDEEAGMVEVEDTAPAMTTFGEEQEEVKYHQILELSRQLLPAQLARTEFTILTFRVKKPGDMKIFLKGSNLQISVHREGFPGSFLDDMDIKKPYKYLPNPEFGEEYFRAVTGMYSIKLKLESTLATYYSMRIEWFPDELPPKPTPTPTPEIVEEDYADEEGTDETYAEEDVVGADEEEAPADEEEEIEYEEE